MPKICTLHDTPELSICLKESGDLITRRSGRRQQCIRGFPDPISKHHPSNWAIGQGGVEVGSRGCTVVF